MRWYLLIPFEYLWFQYIKKINVEKEIINEDKLESDGFFELKNHNLWSHLIGSAQIKMKYHYTSDEVFEKYLKK